MDGFGHASYKKGSGLEGDDRTLSRRWREMTPLSGRFLKTKFNSGLEILVDHPLVNLHNASLFHRGLQYCCGEILVSFLIVGIVRWGFFVLPLPAYCIFCPGLPAAFRLLSCRSRQRGTKRLLFQNLLFSDMKDCAESSCLLPLIIPSPVFHHTKSYESSVAL
jgi:hypothetical protein